MNLIKALANKLNGTRTQDNDVVLTLVNRNVELIRRLAKKNIETKKLQAEIEALKAEVKFIRNKM